MADTQPFRFLDLPKELRLMVYECLPIKTTHHTCEIYRYWVVEEEMTFIYRTLPAVCVLTVCKQIKEEANVIISHKLEHIQSQPVQMIASDETLDGLNMEQAFTCFSKMDSVLNWDPRNIADRTARAHLYAYKIDPEQYISSRRRLIEIAIYQPRSSNMITQQERIQRLQDLFDHLSRFVLTLLGERTPLGVTLRPLELSATEKEIYLPETLQRMRTYMKEEDSSFTRFGTQLDDEEWRKCWAAGEWL